MPAATLLTHRDPSFPVIHTYPCWLIMNEKTPSPLIRLTISHFLKFKGEGTLTAHSWASKPLKGGIVQRTLPPPFKAPNSFLRSPFLDLKEWSPSTGGLCFDGTLLWDNPCIPVMRIRPDPISDIHLFCHYSWKVLACSLLEYWKAEPSACFSLSSTDVAQSHT